MITPKVIDKIRLEIIESQRDTRYSIDAYSFVLAGLDFFRIKIGEHRHVTGQEFAVGLAEFACKQFGPLTCDVLKEWGIMSTDDFGYIVYNMIDIKVMQKQPTDKLEDFFGVVDLAGYCASQDHYSVEKQFIKSIDDA